MSKVWLVGVADCEETSIKCVCAVKIGGVRCILLLR